MQIHQYLHEARARDLMREAERERLANQVAKPRGSIRQAAERLIALLSVQRHEQPEPAHPVPAKLATDSGIYRIR